MECESYTQKEIDLEARYLSAECKYGDVFGFTIITPQDPASRGSQLSFVFLPTGGKTMPKVMDRLAEHGVVGDSRKPDVIRLAPCALYNTFEEVERGAAILEEVLEDVQKEMNMRTL